MNSSYLVIASVLQVFTINSVRTLNHLGLDHPGVKILIETAMGTEEPDQILSHHGGTSGLKEDTRLDLCGGKVDLREHPSTHPQRGYSDAEKKTITEGSEGLSNKLVQFHVRDNLQGTKLPEKKKTSNYDLEDLRPSLIGKSQGQTKNVDPTTINPAFNRLDHLLLVQSQRIKSLSLRPNFKKIPIVRFMPITQSTRTSSSRVEVNPESISHQVPISIKDCFGPLQAFLRAYGHKLMEHHKKPLMKIDEDVAKCGICLEEYKSPETDRTVKRRDRLRYFPSCHHHFHASCIETWLTSDKARTSHSIRSSLTLSILSKFTQRRGGIKRSPSSHQHHGNRFVCPMCRTPIPTKTTSNKLDDSFQIEELLNLFDE